MNDWGRVQSAAEGVGQLMDEIKAYFAPESRITVVVRSPGYEDRDFVLTDDDLTEAAAAIERRRTRPDTKGNDEVAALAACQARQYSDEMVCAPCGLTWDVNERDAPKCRRPAITGRAPGETQDPQPGE